MRIESLHCSQKRMHRISSLQQRYCRNFYY
nr:MAG TPA: hypothetical protein [Caudoviricetes sp.]